MHIHLDLLGGLAGDMFIATLLDAFPEHEQQVADTIAGLATPFGVPAALRCRRVPHHDGILQGSRFEVPEPPAPAADLHAQSHVHAHLHLHAHEHEHDHAHAHEHPAADPHDHGHVAWALIRERLRATLRPTVLQHAIGIFEGLAEAEAQVHGVAPDAVAFHEVGAWDSVADIVGAACLIDLLGDCRWSVGAVPLGGGRVRTAHGPMPVPTPATALLLRGFEMVDDGIAGERVTPTGAALLRYLVPVAGMTKTPVRPARPTRIARTGTGFGTRRLPGISNCTRALVLRDDAPAQAATGSDSAQHRELAVVEFEVDDQSPEDLAVGIDRLRQHADIFDVVHAPVFGKKGRVMSAVRLLARPSALAGVIEACFRETTTIGLRHRSVFGAALPRRAETVEIDGCAVRVKTVERPGGVTAKAESDDALGHASLHARRQLRSEAERLVLARIAQERA